MVVVFGVLGGAIAALVVGLMITKQNLSISIEFKPQGQKGADHEKH